MDNLLLLKETEVYIKGHELLRLEAYPDRNGKSIGWGHFMLKNEYTKIDEAMAQRFYKVDEAIALSGINRYFEKVPLSPIRFKALMDMSYQMGADCFVHFPKAMGHAIAGNWPLAVADFLDSIWARNQTPSRAIDNAILLLEG